MKTGTLKSEYLYSALVRNCSFILKLLSLCKDSSISFYREQQTKVSASPIRVQNQTVVGLFSESWGNPERFQATMEGIHSAKFL